MVVKYNLINNRDNGMVLGTAMTGKDSNDSQEAKTECLKTARDINV